MDIAGRGSLRPVINANINLNINTISIFERLLGFNYYKKNRVNNIETIAKKVKKTAYSILESKSRKFGVLDDKKRNNIGIKYR